MSLAELIKKHADVEAVKRGCVADFVLRDPLAASILTAEASSMGALGQIEHIAAGEQSQAVDRGCVVVVGGEERRVGDGLERAFGDGWNTVEEWGCWTSERHAQLFFTLPTGTPLPVRLNLHFEAYLPLGGKRRLKIRPPSQKEIQVTFDAGSPEQHATVLIRQDDVDPAGRVDLVLESSSLSSPSDTGKEDSRSLGVALRSAALSFDRTDDPAFGRFDLVVDRGTVVSANDDLPRTLGIGWSYLEDWGVWSEHHRMEIGFRLSPQIEGDVRLTLRMRGFIPNARTTLNLVIAMGDSVLAQAKFDETCRGQAVELTVTPEHYLDDRQIRIVLEVDHPRSPSEYEGGGDKRQLGVAIEQILVD